MNCLNEHNLHESRLFNLLVLNGSIRSKKEHVEVLKKDSEIAHRGEIQCYQEMIRCAEYRFKFELRELALSCGVANDPVELPADLQKEYEEREGER